ncbi:hypothetical protein R3W88_024379 [Solanum pinnatisectum]|uniref:Uncharacterized protein n=1 Tax=Solanum pinnatisectum TaxID=50273 RepID=A0AAV9M0E6_9SOLN|nr:hypothetical protein R3W88_024379 [Solanum pinnatisectum]
MTCHQQTAHTQTPKIVAPATGEAQQLNPLTFGSFLPPKVHTIVDEIDDSSVKDEIHLENAHGKETLKR